LDHARGYDHNSNDLILWWILQQHTMKIIPYLLFLIPVATEVYLDFRHIAIRKQVVQHKQETAVRLIIMLGLAILDAHLSGVHWWQSLFLEIAIFWLLFDYTLNIALGRVWWMLGNSAMIDKLMNEWPGFVVLFLKLWVFACAIGVYYHLPWILGNTNY